AGSPMKRIVTLPSLIAAASRYSGHFTSVSEEPLVQLPSVYGPVPTGCVTSVGALFGSTIEPDAWPSRNGRFGSEYFSAMTIVSGSGAVTEVKAWYRLLSLLVEAGAAARS